MKNKLLEAALEYAEAGYAVFPLVPKEKVPLTKNGVKSATKDLDKIREWWERNPDANIGIAMGKISGIVAIDVDYKDGCKTDFLSRVPKTVICKTPTGGHHPYFKYQNSEIKNGLKLEQGATIRSDGYYFVAPPSIHPLGGEYKWEGRSLIDGEIEELPLWMNEIGKKESGKSFSLPERVPHGEQHIDLFKYGCSLRSGGGGMDEAEIVAAFIAVNNRLEKPAPIENLQKLAKDICDRYQKGNKTNHSGNRRNDPGSDENTSPNPVFINPGRSTPSEGIHGTGRELVLPDKGPKGKPKGTIENVKALLDYLGIIVRYNVISKEEEVLIPNESFTVDNKQNASLAHIISWCNRVGVPTENAHTYISNIADKNLYNPVATWIESVPWDGQSRLEDMYDTVESSTPLKKVLMKKWFVSCAAAVYEPNGIAAQGVLVFTGKQNIGKTRWAKSLSPSELNVFKEGAILKPDDKDSVLQIVSKWIVELGELDATFKKSDIAQLKSFLTKDSDTVRRSYARKESNFARRTVFFGSVNDHSFLNDPTGNRRFWTIECDTVQWDHKIDTQQFWAEIRMLYLSGHPWHLTSEENSALSDSNESFQTADPLEEKLIDFYNWEFSTVVEWLTATQVCEKIGITHPNNQQCRKVGAVLRKLGKEKPKKAHGQLKFAIPIPR